MQVAVFFQKSTGTFFTYFLRLYSDAYSNSHMNQMTYNFPILMCNGIGNLKVGSCPNDDNSVQIFFCPFLCSIQIILYFEFVAAKKTARFC